MTLFRRYHTQILLDDRIVGGVPALSHDPDLREQQIEKWMRTQIGEDAPQNLQSEVFKDPDHPKMGENPDSEDENPLNAFKRDENGIYVESRQVKAMLREAAQRLGLLQRKRGTRQVIQHDLHVRAPNDPDGHKLHLFRVDGSGQVSNIHTPDGIDERPISVMTRQGPRTALKRSEYVLRPQIAFDIYLLHDGIGKNIIDTPQLAEMLNLAQWLGIGADRSQGAGCFEVQGVRGPKEVEFDNVSRLIRPWE